MPAPPDFGRTMPPTVSRSSALALSRCAASSTSALRAVAAACRICTPPCWMPFEPDVRPWLGVSAVSPSINVILATSMPSSSAAICGMEIRSPCPRSTLPQNSVTVPSPLTARKASTSLESRIRFATAVLCARPRDGRPVSTKPTVIAPPLSMARREKLRVFTGAFMSASLSGCRHDRAQHPHVRPAAAEVAVERRADVRLARFLVALQERGRAHDHSVRAVAALRHLRGDEGGLQGVRLFRSAEPFERGDLFSLCVGDRGLARSGRGAVDHDGAGAALAESAAELRGGKAEFTQHIEKGFVGIRRVDGLRIAVDA